MAKSGVDTILTPIPTMTISAHPYNINIAKKKKGSERKKQEEEQSKEEKRPTGRSPSSSLTPAPKSESSTAHLIKKFSIFPNLTFSKQQTPMTSPNPAEKFKFRGRGNFNQWEGTD